jgi:hypothetical protein
MVFEMNKQKKFLYFYLITKERLDWFWPYFIFEVFAHPSCLFYIIYKRDSKVNIHELKSALFRIPNFFKKLRD